jgi:molybdopterin-guanine dinucleotide biosynthesis protein A
VRSLDYTQLEGGKQTCASQRFCYNKAMTERALSTIVLAGGHSHRLGQDKALLPWRGRTLIEYIVSQLKAISDDVLVITGPQVRYRELVDVPIFADAIKGAGPMGGLYTGLTHARYDYSFVAACDMPLLSRAVIDLLREELDGSAWAIVPKIADYRVPTLAIYHKKSLSVIERLLAQGRTSLQELLDAIPTKIISEQKLRQIDPALRSFFNLNTPEDWEELIRLELSAP